MAEEGNQQTGDGQDAELEAKIEGILERILARQTPARGAYARGAGGKLVVR